MFTHACISRMRVVHTHIKRESDLDRHTVSVLRSHSRVCSLSLALSLTHSLSLSLTHALTVGASLATGLAWQHMQVRTHTHTHTHTHTTQAFIVSSIVVSELAFLASGSYAEGGMSPSVSLVSTKTPKPRTLSLPGQYVCMHAHLRQVST